MEMLKIGDHVINERYFVGLFCSEVKDGEGYSCSIEARWIIPGESISAQCIHSYCYRGSEDSFFFENELQIAFDKINTIFSKMIPNAVVTEKSLLKK